MNARRQSVLRKPIFSMPTLLASASTRATISYSALSAA
jgi:hypothetical protein